MTHENKLGMFIHWGLYAQTGVQDQVYARFDWSREKYEALINEFNPVNYDPEKWVLLAKEAGMEYTVKLIDEYRVCGIAGIHLYALNKYDDVAKLVEMSGIKDM